MQVRLSVGPWQVEANPKPQQNMAVVTLAEMMEAGAHFGHQTRRWNPKMSRYIYCARNGVHIIDLVQTAVCMNNAYKWVCAARSGKRFLFVGTKKQASEVIALEASRCGASYVNQRWLGGMLTNWTTMRAYRPSEGPRAHGVLRRDRDASLKEAAVLRRELDRLHKYLGGLKNMRRLPDVVVLVDQRRGPTPCSRPASWISPWCRCSIPTAIPIFATCPSPATTTLCARCNWCWDAWLTPSTKAVMALLSRVPTTKSRPDSLLTPVVDAKSFPSGRLFGVEPLS